MSSRPLGRFSLSATLARFRCARQGGHDNPNDIRERVRATGLARGHMRDRGLRYGLQTMREGGGTANATLLELA
jgi:hypothetical protein